MSILEIIKKSAENKILFLPHAVNQMSRLDRMITPSEVRKVISCGEIIENYPKDIRGHSCLMLGFGDNKRPIHVVCAPKNEFLAIITAYIPSGNEWKEDFKERKK
ncbi:MAG: DUF4258 domain-containing protein [Elusimicrobiota bacterium]